MNETMNLHEYYRNHKDAINASIMDIACDLAVGRLLNAHGAPFETFVEADDPDGLFFPNKPKLTNESGHKSVTSTIYFAFTFLAS